MTWKEDPWCFSLTTASSNVSHTFIFFPIGLQFTEWCHILLSCQINAQDWGIISFIQAQVYNYVIVIFFASTFVGLNTTLFMCFQIHQMTEIHKSHHILFHSLLKHKHWNWLKCSSSETDKHMTILLCPTAVLNFF